MFVWNKLLTLPLGERQGEVFGKVQGASMNFGPLTSASGPGQGTPTRRIGWYALLIACAFFVRPSSAEDKLVYVKRDTREQSRAASLAASGQVTHVGGDWYLIG